jgi:Flp pilus assembly protein TadD
MKYLAAVLFLFFVISSQPATASAQGDVRSATGMPIPIGAPVIWGKVELRGLKKDDPKPSIFVTFMHNGAQIARAQANDAGFYYFIQNPRDGAVLLVTVGGTDVGQTVITAAGGERYDFALNWNEGFGANQKTGVVSVRDAYTGRSAANAALFDKAAAAKKDKKNKDAIRMFNEVVAADANDFVAWTELGSLHFEDSKYDDAEKAYAKSLDLKPDFMIALMNLGKLHIAQKQFDKAVPVLERAVAADAKSADAKEYLGEAYLQTRQGNKAVGVLNEAIALDPIGKAEVHLRLASLYNAANLKDRAAAEYKLFLEKKPNYAEKSKLEKYIKDNSK